MSSLLKSKFNIGDLIEVLESDCSPKSEVGKYGVIISKSTLFWSGEEVWKVYMQESQSEFSFASSEMKKAA